MILTNQGMDAVEKTTKTCLAVSPFMKHLKTLVGCGVQIQMVHTNCGVARGSSAENSVCKTKEKQWRT